MRSLFLRILKAEVHFLRAWTNFNINRPQQKNSGETQSLSLQLLPTCETLSPYSPPTAQPPEQPTNSAVQFRRTFIDLLENCSVILLFRNSLPNDLSLISLEILYASFTQFLVRVRQVGGLFPNPKSSPHCFALVELDRILRFGEKVRRVIDGQTNAGILFPSWGFS